MEKFCFEMHSMTRTHGYLLFYHVKKKKKKLGSTEPQNRHTISNQKAALRFYLARKSYTSSLLELIFFRTVNDLKYQEYFFRQYT